MTGISGTVFAFEPSTGLASFKREQSEQREQPSSGAVGAAGAAGAAGAVGAAGAAGAGGAAGAAGAVGAVGAVPTPFISFVVRLPIRISLSERGRYSVGFFIGPI